MGNRSQLSETVWGNASAPGMQVTMWMAEAIGVGCLRPCAILGRMLVVGF